MAPATVQQTAAAKGESEDFGNFSYETQTEGLFVAFAIKIPNAFTDFDLWADERKATPSPGVPLATRFRVLCLRSTGTFQFAHYGKYRPGRNVELHRNFPAGQTTPT